VAGFAAAVTAVPSKEQQELRRLVEYERLSARARRQDAKANRHPETKNRRKSARGMAGWVNPNRQRTSGVCPAIPHQFCLPPI